MLDTPTPRVSRRNADADGPDWGWTTSSVELYTVVVGTYAESPPLARRVVMNLEFHVC